MPKPICAVVLDTCISCGAAIFFYAHQTLAHDEVGDFHVFRGRLLVRPELGHEVLAECVRDVRVDGL